LESVEGRDRADVFGMCNRADFTDQGLARLHILKSSAFGQNSGGPFFVSGENSHARHLVS
jgi:hypothetical protein